MNIKAKFNLRDIVRVYRGDKSRWFEAKIINIAILGDWGYPDLQNDGKRIGYQFHNPIKKSNDDIKFWRDTFYFEEDLELVEKAPEYIVKNNIGTNDKLASGEIEPISVSGIYTPRECNCKDMDWHGERMSDLHHSKCASSILDFAPICFSPVESVSDVKINGLSMQQEAEIIERAMGFPHRGPYSWESPTAYRHTFKPYSDIEFPKNMTFSILDEANLNECPYDRHAGSSISQGVEPFYGDPKTKEDCIERFGNVRDLPWLGFDITSAKPFRGITKDTKIDINLQIFDCLNKSDSNGDVYSEECIEDIKRQFNEKLIPDEQWVTAWDMKASGSYCNCAELTWLPEYYTMEHHPDCEINARN